jgi:hypothetical protein
MAYGASMSNIVATRNLYTEHQNIAGTTEEDRRHFLEQEKKNRSWWRLETKIIHTKMSIPPSIRTTVFMNHLSDLKQEGTLFI